MQPKTMQRQNSWVDLSIASILKEGLNGPEGFTWRLSGLDRVRLAVSFFSGSVSHAFLWGTKNRQSHRGVWFRPLHLTLEPLEEQAITWPPPGVSHRCEVGFFVWQTIFVQLSLRKVQVHEPGRDKLAAQEVETLNIHHFEFTSQLHFPRLGTVTALIVNMLAQQLLGN